MFNQFHYFFLSKSDPVLAIQLIPGAGLIIVGLTGNITENINGKNIRRNINMCFLGFGTLRTACIGQYMGGEEKRYRLTTYKGSKGYKGSF